MPHVPARIVYEDPTNFVRLEKDPTVLAEYPESHHRHPFSIEPDEMAKILKGLWVQERRNWLERLIVGEAAPTTALSAEEVALLASRLAEALARAAPDERVTFYLSQPQTSIKRVITTGGLYIGGEALHFVLGNYRVVYGIPAYGMIYDRRYPMMPTAPKTFTVFYEHAHAMIPQPSTIWSRLLGRARDEVVIDLSTIGGGRHVARGPGAVVTGRSAAVDGPRAQTGKPDA